MAPAIILPTAEVPGRRERVDAVCPPRQLFSVAAGVLHHVAQAVSDLARRLHYLFVVAVVEERTLAIPKAVEAAGDADLEALDAAGQASGVIGLADQVDVVSLDRELADTEAVLLAAANKRPSEHRGDLEAAEARQAALDAGVDVDRKTGGELGPGAVTDPFAPRLALATGLLALATPGAGESDVEL